MKRTECVAIACLALAVGSSAATLTVTSPNGGENWAQGSPHPITWTAAGVSGKVKLVLFKAGVKFGDIASDVPASQQNYSWVVGNSDGGMAPAGNDYKVKVRTLDNTVVDLSNGTFTIGPPSPGPGPGPGPDFALTSPNGGESWPLGSTQLITWNPGVATGYVRLDLYKGGSAPANLMGWIKSMTPAATGKYSWHVGDRDGMTPAALGGDYFVVVHAYTPDLRDPGNGPFTIAPRNYPKSIAQAVALPVAPFINVVTPAKNGAARNGEHSFICFDAYTMPGDAIEIDLYRESGTQKLFNIYYGAYGQGTSVPPTGPDHPRRYLYDWQVPFGDIMAPGYYKIRIHSLGKEIIAWSGRFYITWPMREKEYLFDAAITNTLCISSTAGLAPMPVRPKCEQYWNPNHAYAGFDVFDYPGSITWTDGEVHQYWRWYIHHSRLIFPIEQFQGKKVKVIQAKVILKKECTVAVNSNLASCARTLYRLTEPLPQSTSGDPCLNTQKTALVTLQYNVTEQDVYVTHTLEHWIDGTYPNYGFLLTVDDETPPAVAATCVSGYTVKLYLKIEEEYKGYT
jgi:hypothetical protein